MPTSLHLDITPPPPDRLDLDILQGYSHAVRSPNVRDSDHDQHDLVPLAHAEVIWEPWKPCKPIPPPSVLVIVPNSVLLYEVRNSGPGHLLNQEQQPQDSGTDGLSLLVRGLDSSR